MSNFFIVNDNSHELQWKGRLPRQWEKQIWIGENPANNVDIVLQKVSFPWAIPILNLSLVRKPVYLSCKPFNSVLFKHSML